MKRKPLLIASGYILIVLLTVLSIIIGGQSYTVFVNNPYGSQKYEIKISDESVVENTGIKDYGDNLAFVFRSLKKGKSNVRVTVYNEKTTGEYTTVYQEFSVLPTGVLYITNYDYGGLNFTLLGMAVLCTYTFIICLVQFIKRKKTQFFSYKTMLDLALFLFFGLHALMYSGLYGMVLILPERAAGWVIYNIAGFTMSAVVGISIPVIVIFAAFLSMSNIALIKREGLGKNNIFALFISLVLFVGSVLSVYYAVKNPNSTDIQFEYVRDAVIRSIVSSAFVYFECVLFSAMVCTQYAARYKPKYNQDFIVILGCKAGKDGKPLPLLRGRIDRALTFYNKQLEKTGKKALFIPSGGKGSDEVISEAECIKNYLIENGIEEEGILPETRSVNTLQNMKFSKEIADSHKKDANILFSTTNYHVFRSGIYSARAGMRADGIGAKTKWYFWPNAQMREFIGMLVNEWKINLAVIFTVVAVSVLFANISSVINLFAG